MTVATGAEVGNPLSRPIRRSGLFGALAVGWTAYAVFRIAQTLLLDIARPPGELTAANKILLSLSDGGLMIAMTPFAVAAARRFPISFRRLGNLIIHFVIGVTLASIAMIALRLLGEWLMHAQLGMSLAAYLLNSITGSMFAYSVVVAATQAFDSQRRAADQELRAATLEGMLSSARLDALRAQLQPHFLFNTLHAISELVHLDPDAADAMLDRLGQLLRRTLEAASRDDFAVTDEVAYAAAYLDIHRIRYRDRLQTTYDVSPAVAAARVPSLIMQPLVENAIRHGIECSEHGGTIAVSVTERGDMLCLEVTNDGPGLADPIVEGVGIASTRKRLEELYHERQSLTIESRTPPGARVTILLPLEFAR